MAIFLNLEDKNADTSQFGSHIDIEYLNEGNKKADQFDQLQKKLKSEKDDYKEVNVIQFD